MDSVRRGFPIGTLLLWKRSGYAPAQTLDLGPVQLDVPLVREALWVIDGQQRITALVGALLHPPPDHLRPSDDFEFYFDLERQDFVRRSQRKLPAPSWLPMSEVIDSARLLKWLRQQDPKLPEDLEALAFEFGKTIREYPVHAVVVEGDSEDVPREIFERINSAGHRLSEDEIFNALHGTRSGDSPRGFEEMAQSLSDLRFGDASELPLRQSVLAVRGMDPTRKASGLRASKELQGAMADATTSLRRVVIFLKQDARIPNVRLLPYRFLVIPLARFFHRFPEPAPRSRELLVRWLWRVCAAGTFHGEARQIRAAVRAVGDHEEESVQRLLAQVKRNADGFRLSSRFDMRTAESRIVALALFAAEPVDLQTGASLDCARLFREKGDELFARALLRTPGGANLNLGSAANRFVYPGGGGQKLIDLLVGTAEVRERWLQTHLVTGPATSALKQREWARFLGLRTHQLEAQTARFLSSRMRWEDPDRPSLNALFSEASS